MASAAETTARQWIGEVVGHVDQAVARSRGFGLFLELLLASAGPDSLAGLGSELLAREAIAGFAALEHRERGRHRLAIRPSPFVPRGLVIEIVNDDMPFLVDSVLGELQARGMDVVLVLHPIFKAEREENGRLVSVTAPGDTHWGDGRQESYMALHVAARGPALTEPRQAELAAAVSGILDDVRLVVGDWKAMLARISEAIVALRTVPVALPLEVRAESVAFLSWLAEGNFTFIGARDYRLVGSPETGELATDEAAGLGLLRDPETRVLRRGSELVTLTPEIRQFFFSADPLIITKANVVSRVHRRVHLDYVGIKQYGVDGRVTGELRVVGLFTSTAYTQSPRAIPVLRRKVEDVVDRLRLPAESHAGKALVNVLETFPRDELFQISIDELGRWAEGILDLDHRPRVRVFARYDRFDRFLSALVYVPRDGFSTRVRAAIGESFAERVGGYVAAFYPRFTDGPLVRVHFIIARRDGALPRVPVPELEAAVARIVRTWDDELADALAEAPDALRLAATYRDAFATGYTETYSIDRALEDITGIERLGPARRMTIDVHRESGSEPSRVRAAIYCLDGPLRLSDRVPLLENLGFTVIDERTWRLAPRPEGRRQSVVLHDMVLETFDGRALDLTAETDARLEATFLAVMGGVAESDRFNRLVMAAGIDWREAALLRAYAAYLRQLGSALGPAYVADTLVNNVAVVRDLVALFHTAHDPDTGLDPDARAAAAQPIAARIEVALTAVASLDEDRILRQLLALVTATVRTTFYRPGDDGGPAATLAFKLDGARLDMAPEPRPYREIFVTGPRVEGVHMRFAPIARGGIRWSDRPQDYRTEVLGLAKAQQVKNAVIVPAGAKGGFFPKQLPRGGSREDIQAEGVAAYTTFVSALLDLTDNVVDGVVRKPDRVVPHDGDDPYLVVAADKGTATFSDTANAIARGRGFWLGDAFASGGSAGYDHKGMGITARGAWECVKRHFRELNQDIQTTPFTVIGVGDMSGDVFGNGMLLSRATRLVAAFDHRHIFLDPDPDPETSFGERRRLVDLPRSSWADYDTAKLSPGGGVFPRSAKAIELSPEVRRRLGLTATVLTPAELIRAILKAPADLLWLGGIGTYVRATGETDLEVGDRSNDPVRITASELGVRVVGEGANLGMTQRGRVEAAQRGIKLNTDFIDNSAGVNTSDQEVNIKIALAPAVTAGKLDMAERDTLLAAMSEEVARAVLRNNYQQSLALSLAERRVLADMGALGRLIGALETRGLVNRQLEALPGRNTFLRRAEAGQGLTRPELAVIMSFTKIAMLHDILASSAPDDPFLDGLLEGYFPAAMRERFASEIRGHRLRREIVATTLTNGVVNRLGLATPPLLAEASSRPIAEVAFAFMAARQALGLADVWQRIDALDGQIEGSLQLDLYERARKALVTAVGDILRDEGPGDAIGPTVQRLEAGVAALSRPDARIVPAAMAGAIADEARDLVERGVPEDVAEAVARLALLRRVPGLVGTARLAGVDVARAAFHQLSLAAALGLDLIADAGEQIAALDDYERLAVQGGLQGLSDGGRRLTLAALARYAGDTEEGLGRWLAGLGPVARRAMADLAVIAGEPGISVARLTVASARVAALADAAHRQG
jgi:glutamate dehydrogenase